MKAAGITLSTVGAGGGSNPFLEQLARNGGGRFYDAREPVVDPRHLPQGDPAGLGPADRGGEVLPDPDRRSSPILRGHRGRLPALLGLQRHDGEARGPDGARHRRATTRSSPSGSTASGGRWPGRPTRPGAGPRAGSAGTASRKFFSQMVGWTFPGEESGGIEADFVDRGGRTFLRVESVEPDGSPRDFYSTRVALVGPDLEPVDGRPVAGRAGRVRDAGRRRSRAAPTRCA